jgi:hypothetical protein
MTTRERTLAIALLGLIFVAGGAFAGYTMVYSPIQGNDVAAAKLGKEIEELKGKKNKLLQDRAKLVLAQKRSLPADEHVAKQQYYAALDRMLREAKVPLGFTITPRSVDNRGVPTLEAKKPAYTRLQWQIQFKKADMWAVHDFLTAYYKLNLLHQITELSIKREEEGAQGSGTRRTANAAASDNRSDLTVTLTTEAIILDGAENRPHLLSVPGAFAAVGGVRGATAVGLTPDAALALTPERLKLPTGQVVPQVLATRERDYSLLVLKDIFHGPLPPAPPFRFAKLADVALAPGEAPRPVPVRWTGDTPNGEPVDLKAVFTGTLFHEGELRVDPNRRTIVLPPLADPAGSGSVEVVATTRDGKQLDKATFRVSVRTGDKEDVSVAILLIGVTGGPNGTVAWIRDQANKLAYQVEAGPSGVKVTKFKYEKDDRRRNVEEKRRDVTYEDEDLLIISDDTSSTTRRFRVVGVEEDGLIVADLRAESQAAAPTPPRKGGGGGFGKGPPTPARPAVTVAGPLASVVGVAAATAPAPKLYRWTAGKPLSGLTEIPADEARKILHRAAANGPLGINATAAALDE